MWTGNPIDDEEDMDLDCWAGVILLKIKAEKPIDDSLLKAGIEVPDYALNYER